MVGVWGVLYESALQPVPVSNFYQEFRLGEEAEQIASEQRVRVPLYQSDREEFSCPASQVNHNFAMLSFILPC